VVAIRSQYFGEVPTDAGTGPGNQNRLMIVCDDGLSEATGSELFALLWAAELPATEKEYLYANSQECDMINQPKINRNHASVPAKSLFSSGLPCIPSWQEAPMYSQPVAFSPSYARQALRLLLVAQASMLLALAGCSDSDDPPPPPPPPPVEGVISGTLIVPPNHSVEIEPNNTPDTAQTVSQAARLAGTASASDSGYPLPDSNGVLTDVYQFDAAAPARVSLTLGADILYRFDPETQTITEIVNDLNLAVLDDQGNVVAVSDGLTENESIDIMAPGLYYIGVSAAVGASPYVLAVTPLQVFSRNGEANGIAAQVTPANFVAGEVLVKSRRASVASVKERREIAKAHGADYGRTLSSGVDILTLPHKEASAKLQSTQTLKGASSSITAAYLRQAATIEIIKRLQADPDVVWAQPNYIRRPQIVPDDEEYDLQWHYEQINLPDAWDTTTGSDSIIVAVLDTGILSGHPDLAGRLIPGYDFVSSLSRAQDGDGIDPDSEDPGDDPDNSSSSFHGTHVAGTIGAATNNSIGVAGVTWQTRIMPVRVLGAGGGTAAEVSQGIRFAAGLPNDSGTVPPEPARIINMSLGGAGTSPIEQNAITDARAAGTIVIAAAGNNSSSDIYSPASLDGVISVSAVAVTEMKASYSNYGPTVDVAAPGGEFWDSDGDDNLDAVRSTLGTDDGNFNYRYYQGTSMASPHVAGVVALMLSVNPTLTPDDIDMLLAGTHAETSRRITRDLGREGRDDKFGHGLIDAAAAVLAASEVTGGETPPGPQGSRLAVFPQSLDFSNYLFSQIVDISNAGIDTLNVTSVTTDATWLAATPASGVAPLIIDVTVDRSGLADGVYTGQVLIASDATEGESNSAVDVSMTVSEFQPGDAGPVIIQLRSADGSVVIEELSIDATTDYGYSLPAVGPGSYLVTAGSDRDNDGVVCEIEDACNQEHQEVTINSTGDDISGVDLLIIFGAGQKTPPVENE
jgi:serine protease